MDQKYCSKCGTLKKQIDFYKNRAKCKSCMKLYEKEKRIKEKIETKNDIEDLKNLFNKY